MPNLYSSHSLSSDYRGEDSLLPPFRWDAPASSTRGCLPIGSRPLPKATFDQLLESIKNMDKLVSLPSWHNYMNRERALELTRVLRDYGGYKGIHWNLTSGAANPTLDSLIRCYHPNYPSHYSAKGYFDKILVPGTDVEFDTPHFNASLSKYLDNDGTRQFIPKDWAGWAGDMFSFAKNLDSLNRYGGLEMDSIRNLAMNSLGNSDSFVGNTFGKEDFYADIDARNISSLIKSGLSYYDAMDNYYNNDLYGRFGNFINSYGGWKNFVKKVESYNFFPLTPTLNPVFLDFAKKAFINKIREGCLNEMGCYIP